MVETSRNSEKANTVPSFKLTQNILDNLLKSNFSIYPASIKNMLTEYQAGLLKLNEDNNLLLKINPYVDENKKLDRDIESIRIEVAENEALIFRAGDGLIVKLLNTNHTSKFIINKIQPLVSINNDIKTLQLEIEELNKKTGLFEKTKALAKKTFLFGKIKLLELNHSSTAKKIDKEIIQNQGEDNFRTQETASIIDAIKERRDIYSQSKAKLDGKINDQNIFFGTIPRELTANNIQTSNELYKIHKNLKSDISNQKDMLESIRKEIEIRINEDGIDLKALEDKEKKLREKEKTDDDSSKQQARQEKEAAAIVQEDRDKEVQLRIELEEKFKKIPIQNRCNLCGGHYAEIYYHDPGFMTKFGAYGGWRKKLVCRNIECNEGYVDVQKPIHEIIYKCESCGKNTVGRELCEPCKIKIELAAQEKIENDRMKHETAIEDKRNLVAHNASVLDYNARVEETRKRRP